MTIAELQSEIEVPSKNRFEYFFQSDRLGVFLIDPSGHLQQVNKQACYIFGCENDDAILGRHINKLEFLLSRPIVEEIEQIISGKPQFEVSEFPGTNLQGHFAYHRLICSRSCDENGNFLGVMGMIEKISDRVKIEKEQKKRIDELSILSEISKVVASALDPDELLKVILTGVTAGQGLGFNRAFLLLKDDASNKLIGRLAVGPADAEEAGKIWSALEQDERSLTDILSLYKEDSLSEKRRPSSLIDNLEIDLSVDSQFSKAINNRQALFIDLTDASDQSTIDICTKLGQKQAAITPLISRDHAIGLLVVDNAITGATITDSDRQFLNLIADQSAAALERSYLYRDIKERALLLEESNRKLAETQSQIIQAEKMSVIGEITAAVAHELRNPLTIIGGFANLMLESQRTEPTGSEYLRIITSETQRAEAVLTDLLDFSKASRMENQQVEMNTVVGKVIDMLAVRFGKDLARVKLEPGEESMPVWGNPDQLIHAFYQILTILFQELPDGVVPCLSTYVEDNSVKLLISFPGQGNNNGQLGKLLKLYFGAKDAAKRLALIVAEETLRHHGGQLGLASNPEAGPALYVQLPLNKDKGYV